MKKYMAIAAVVLTAISGCRGISRTEETEGTLSFADFTIMCDDELVTKAASAASGNYSVIITDPSGDVVKTTTYAAVKAADGSITLPAGDYVLIARSSQEEVPASAFEQPVYGASTEFSISAGKTTAIGTLTCTLVQCKVTVSYDDAFLADVTGNGQAEVTVTAGYPLVYELQYSAGSASYDQSAGYFAVNNGDKTTMTVVFKGSIEGKSQKMSATLTGISPRQWRQIKFIKKVDEQGNASFGVSISDYVSDEELVVDMKVDAEEVIGDDPDAPRGDGGISLAFASDCTMFDDLNNIVVPDMSVPMDLRLDVTVPNGVKKFIVHIESTSDSFIKAVNAAGGTDLDLVNPSAESEVVFQIVPFAHGESLRNQTNIAFDLSNAQEAILGFPGEHTFVMDITDNSGCSNKVPVTLIVE